MESSPRTDQHDTYEDALNAVEQRRAILGPCLAAMGFAEHGDPPPNLPPQLRFEGFVIELEPWEHNLLLGHAGANNEALLAHLAEGLAFQARCGSLLHVLEVDPPQATDLGRLGEVIEQAAVGIALQEEVQRDIDRLVGLGAMADAKKLTGFRHKIDHGLSDLNKSLDDDAQGQAQARSAEMLTPRSTEPATRKKIRSSLALDLPVSAPAVPVETAEINLDEPQPAAEELFELGLIEQKHPADGVPIAPRHRRSAKPNPAGRFRSLLCVLVVSVVLYAIFLSVRPRTVPVPERLGMESFSHLDGVLQVRPRPPSLYVKLDARSWADMSAQDRLDLVNSLGGIAGREGYFGVQVKTNDGRTVGQWMKKSGAKLIFQASSS